MIIRSLGIVGALLLPVALSACDMGPYDPSAHHQAESSTGSMLSGVDTNVNGNGTTKDPSISSNYGGTPHQ